MTKSSSSSRKNSKQNGSTTETTEAAVVSMHWFRKALRLHDNPSLLTSLRHCQQQKSGQLLYPVHILDGDSYQLYKCSPLRANFYVECVQDLDASLKQCGSKLYVQSGDPIQILPKLWSKWNVTHLTFEEDETGEPYATKRDVEVIKLAKECGIVVETCASETLHPLQSYVDKCGGNVEKVASTMGGFTTLLGKVGPVGKPLDAPTKQDFPTMNHDDNDEEFVLPQTPTDLPWPRNIPKSDVTPLWNKSDCQNLTPLVRGGETLALQQLTNTVSKHPSWVASFEKPKTSCTATLSPSTTVLSPYLSWGCLSPRTVWHSISKSIKSVPPKASQKFSKPPVSLHGQLMWRDFNNLMAHCANVQHEGSWGTMENNPYCRNVRWSSDESLQTAWRDGKTGYPWIDACMNQLKEEGWIHHLGRHAVACFLTRGDLWQSWEYGAEIFESSLLDADYALNGFNWLWLSCSGFFYQYFRCYSPVAFQKKNDATGAYIRKWVPALKKMPDKYIYEPWKAPRAVQEKCGCVIGVDYPKPIVDHASVSKENMTKMSAAYDAHKAMVEKNKTKKGGEKKTKRGEEKNVGGVDAPAKKKAKRQTKLKQTKLK